MFKYTGFKLCLFDSIILLLYYYYYIIIYIVYKSL